MFAELYSEYQKELTAVNAKLDALESVLNEIKKGESAARQFVDALKRYDHITELTRELVIDLIERIVVHEATGSRYDGTRHLKTDIYFRFIGTISEV